MGIIYGETLNFQANHVVWHVGHPSSTLGPVFACLASYLSASINKFVADQMGYNRNAQYIETSKIISILKNICIMSRNWQNRFDIQNQSTCRIFCDPPVNCLGIQLFPMGNTSTNDGFSSQLC